uniref:ATP synthase complex subunit 8 n=1 Tax=Sicyopterus eudentatus TaxID=2597637 RepID=A0A516IAH3_9GOBI|nr:ATP synthase F0 subunit 8 [Sicyopterus eudentatus]QDP13063.1 ATP synthase F0 subunit 8 [Sicyopterus eudentatus]QDP13076.1 ATP synthase F0 subunit 8 [Sicyopterus eudentatus]QDP13089.1 ATP synthase F0 subunit 8 [Sicyopterus eudentatus]QDP13102.1 ATP synthase F0 subunit 8 [Sicyopterus eudentatus]
MPQLNPAPWFAILVFSWLVFLTIAVPKVLNYTFPNEPTPQSTQVPKTDPWTWPW